MGKGAGASGGERRRNSCRSRGRPLCRVKQRRAAGRSRRQRRSLGARRHDRDRRQRHRGKREPARGGRGGHVVMDLPLEITSPFTCIAWAARVVQGRRCRWARGGARAFRGDLLIGRADGAVDLHADDYILDDRCHQGLQQLLRREPCCNDWLAHEKLLVRVGEATNPGPPNARWCGPEGAQYRDPSATGFWCARAPGHPPERAANGDAFALRVITANTTSWGPLKTLLCRTDADIVLVQEHHLPPFHLAEASDWARRHQWHSIFLPAERTQAGGWSAGVAIIARPHAALSAPRIGSETVVPSRVLAACVEPPGHRQTLVISAYLKDGAGLSAMNLGYLAAVGTCINMHGPNYPFVVGGDFQISPEEIARTGFRDHVGATLITSAAARGTCRSTKRCSELDYFLSKTPWRWE